MSKKYYIATFGCQMNKNDSERISGLLLSLGFKEAISEKDADFLIVNTCSVRKSAEDRVFGQVRNWQKLRLKKSDLIIAITGCMAGRDKDGELKSKIPGVDLFFGIDELPHLPQWLSELRHNWFKGDLENAGDEYLSITPHRKNNIQAFITIQSGCDNFCSYCVVPFARGREKNRLFKDIIKEAKQLAESGCLEITLLGQVVNNYKAKDIENFNTKNPFRKVDHFAALLWEINNLDSLKRIFFTAPDPQYFSDAQIEALKLSKLMNYLHLPVQSGNNEILKKMNRKYAREFFIDLVKKIRVARPNIALGTDFILGFCGETVQQFEDTVDLYKQCDFDVSFPAMYSERTGTAAKKLYEDDVKQEEKKYRWSTIQSLMEKITLKKNQKYKDKKVDVLVEKCYNGLCSGNSNEMKLVQFLGKNDLVGKIVSIEIFDAQMWVLKGRLK